MGVTEEGALSAQLVWNLLRLDVFKHAACRYPYAVDSLLEERNLAAKEIESAAEGVIVALSDQDRTIDQIITAVREHADLDEAAVLSAIWKVIGEGQAELRPGLRLRRRPSPA